MSMDQQQCACMEQEEQTPLHPASKFTLLNTIELMQFWLEHEDDLTTDRVLTKIESLAQHVR